MNYFICGFSGAGKSYLLKQLELSNEFKEYQFVDLDFLVDQKYAADYDSLGKYIEEIGFDKFRELELQEIQTLVNGDKQFLALGGGALNKHTEQLFTENWQGLWLATDFETCYQRIKDDENRPLSKLAKNELSQLYTERSDIYRSYQKINSAAQVIEITKS